jgi:hypothetical protein
MSDAPPPLEYSVESDASPAFAWSYWTDVRNWADPPARFTLDGTFSAGSTGTTWMPGQEPLHWVIEAVEPWTSAKIQMQLDRATMSFEWWFEALSNCRTKLTQRIELRGENAEAYATAQAAFRANLPDGMTRIAAAMAQAEAVARSASPL